MTETEARARLEFRRAALVKLREAYLALIDGGAKSYTIGDRTLTRLDLGRLQSEIEQTEKKADELEAALSGGRARRAFGIIPMDW
jgi:hypothetical protein